MSVAHNPVLTRIQTLPILALNFPKQKTKQKKRHRVLPIRFFSSRSSRPVEPWAIFVLRRLAHALYPPVPRIGYLYLSIPTTTYHPHPSGDLIFVAPFPSCILLSVWVSRLFGVSRSHWFVILILFVYQLYQGLDRCIVSCRSIVCMLKGNGPEVVYKGQPHEHELIGSKSIFVSSLRHEPPWILMVQGR